MSNCLKGCLPSQDLAYHKIESEIEKDPNWPPVSKKKVLTLEKSLRKNNSFISRSSLKEIRKIIKKKQLFINLFLDLH